MKHPITSYKSGTLSGKLSLALLVSITLLTSCGKEDYSDIYEEPGYAIGTIASFVSVPFKVTYTYEFEVDGILHEGNEIAKGIGQLDERLIGKSFLVVYKLTDIDDNDLNFNYLIESDDEFEKLVESFENDPPTPD